MLASVVRMQRGPAGKDRPSGRISKSKSTSATDALIIDLGSLSALGRVHGASTISQAPPAQTANFSGQNDSRLG